MVVMEPPPTYWEKFITGPGKEQMRSLPVLAVRLVARQMGSSAYNTANSGAVSTIPHSRRL